MILFPHAELLFKIIADRCRNRRKRFGLRFNLIAGLYNWEIKSWVSKEVYYVIRPKRNTIGMNDHIKKENWKHVFTYSAKKDTRPPRKGHQTGVHQYRCDKTFIPLPLWYPNSALPLAPLCRFFYNPLCTVNLRPPFFQGFCSFFCANQDYKNRLIWGVFIKITLTQWI